MTTLTRTLVASALAAAALTPAAASGAGADNTLRGAPTMRVLDSDTATLQFATKKALPKGKDGKPRLSIRFAGRQKVVSLKADGRHGSSRRYVARVSFPTAPRVGAKYTVTFRFAGQDAVKRLVKLHDKKA